MAQFGPDVHHLAGRGEDLAALLTKEFDLIIANECIGDFHAVRRVPRTRGGSPTGGLDDPCFRDFPIAEQDLWNQAWETIERYNLTVPTLNEAFDFVVPTGQIAFVEQLAKILKRGGSALVIEHCLPYSRTVRMPGHTEVSMSRNHLSAVAAELGLEAKFCCLRELLQIDDPSEEVVVSHEVNYILYFGMTPAQHLNQLKAAYSDAQTKLRGGCVPDNYPPFVDMSPERRKLLEGELACPKARRVHLERMRPPVLERQDQWERVQLDPRNKHLDRYLTPKEFQEECGLRGWAHPAFTNPTTEYISAELSKFGAFIFRKPL